jgi:AcrR family transcriptional regulator
MNRSYIKNKRAENQAETRQRIVEAAVGLHGEVGPAHTTISMVAERAGVQRHTVYSHFPDERSLLMACSGTHLAQHPVPSPAAWADIGNPGERITAALTALYAWYAENEQMIGNVLRDAERHTLLREVSDLRFGAPLAAIIQSLAQPLGAKGKAMLGLALSFYTWRTLTGISGLKARDAVALQVAAILGADAKR